MDIIDKSSNSYIIIKIPLDMNDIEDTNDAKNKEIIIERRVLFNSMYFTNILNMDSSANKIQIPLLKSKYIADILRYLSHLADQPHNCKYDYTARHIKSTNIDKECGNHFSVEFIKKYSKLDIYDVKSNTGLLVDAIYFGIDPLIHLCCCYLGCMMNYYSRTNAIEFYNSNQLPSSY